MQPERLIGSLCPAAGIECWLVKFHAALIILCIAIAPSIAARAQTAATATVVKSDQPPLPSWLKSGTVRFARFDGGAIETQKTLRSEWAAQFTCLLYTSPSPRDTR